MSKKQKKNAKHIKALADYQKSRRRLIIMSTISINPLRLKDVDFAKLRFSEKKETKNPKGTDNVFLSYGDDSQWLYVQFPSLRHPFDPNVNDDGSMTITLSFDKANPKHQVAIENLRNFDAKIFETLKDNSEAWLKKKTLDDKWKNDKYTSFLKIKEVENESGDLEERFFNIKIKLPAKDRNITTLIYDTNMNAMDPSFVTPRCSVEPIARPARLWFQKTGKVGITWECALMRVKKPESNVPVDQIFKNDSDDETSAPAENAPTTETVEDIPEDAEPDTTEDANDEVAEPEDIEEEPASENTEDKPLSTSKPRGGRKGKAIAK